MIIIVEEANMEASKATPPAAAAKAPPMRKRVGQKATPQGQGTSTPKGAAPKATPDERASKLQEESVDPVTYITLRDGGSFQLRASQDNPNGSSSPEWTLEFVNGLLEATPEDIEAVQMVLAGKWSDRRVPARVFEENARMAGLGIHKFGLEQAPMPTWETLEEEQVVPVGLAAGALGTVDAVKRAIRYEKQSGERQPAREARGLIVKQLEAQLAILEAYDVQPSSMPVVKAMQGGNVVGSAGMHNAVPGLALGSSELG